MRHIRAAGKAVRRGPSPQQSLYYWPGQVREKAFHRELAAVKRRNLLAHVVLERGRIRLGRTAESRWSALRRGQHFEKWVTKS